MATITSRFDNTTNRDLLKEGSLRQIFDTTLEKAQSFYGPLVNSKKTDLWIERDLRMAGLTTAQRVYEGENIPLQTPTMGTTKEYTQMSFGTGFRMTRVMEKANKHGLWKKWAGQLADVQKTAKDIEIHTMFNNMTSTSLECGVGFDYAGYRQRCSHGSVVRLYGGQLRQLLGCGTERHGASVGAVLFQDPQGRLRRSGECHAQ